MKLDKALAHNFLTFKNFEYSFLSKPLLLQGLNLTDDGQETNGTGKSGLQTIIEQCITATNSRGVKDSELVRFGEAFGNIQLYASCDVRKQKLWIDYDIYVKGSNKLRLHTQEYGTDIWKPVDFGGVPHGKKYVTDWFAIASEDLFNYYIINKQRFKSFFVSSNTDKVALINRFSDASIVDGVEDVDTETEKELYKTAGEAVTTINGKIAQATEMLENEQNRNLKSERQDLEDEIDLQITDINTEIDFLKNTIPTIRSEKAGFEKTIEEQNELKAVYDKEKLELDSKVKIAKDDLKTAEIALENAKKVVSEYKTTDWTEKRKSHKEEIAKLIETGKTARKEEETANGNKAEITQILNNVNIALKGSVTCPKCEHEFIVDGDIEKVKEHEAGALKLKPVIEKACEDALTKINSIKTKIGEIEVLVSAINGQEQAQNSELNKLSQAVTRVSGTVNDMTRTVNGFDQSYGKLKLKEDARLLAINQAKGKIDNIEVRVEAVNTEIAGYEGQKTTLEQSKANLKVNSNVEQIKSLKEQIATLEADFIKADAEHNRLGDELVILNQWSKNFKNFRLFLANKSLDVIEYHCNRYLDEMGSDMTVKLEGFKVLADGSVKDEITTKIIRKLERSFNSFSGGERGRLLFSAILANRFMINETHPYGGLDFLSIDEVFEGVDSVGVMSLVESAKLLNIPVIIITHVSVDETEDVITMVKENDISYIKAS